MSISKQVRALRGATTADDDTPAAIEEATAELLRGLVDLNDVAEREIVSIVFTSTADLSSAYPAGGAHALGWTEVPLLCVAELDVPGSLRRCIRVLMHLYTDRDYATLRHVYLRGARSLRADRTENS